MQIRQILLSSLLALLITSCSSVELYDGHPRDPGEIATLLVEKSPNTDVDDVFINNVPISPPRTVKVVSGEQNISFKYTYVDVDNLLAPTFHGTCSGSFFAGPQKVYTINSSGVWLNQAQETRFWVVQPQREQATAFNCTKVEGSAPPPVVGKEDSTGFTSRVDKDVAPENTGSTPNDFTLPSSKPSAWDPTAKPVQEQDLDTPPPAPREGRDRY